MFTGLIEGTGVISGRRGSRLLVKPDLPMEGVPSGSSIAVNGCCLTLERATAAGELEFFVTEESLSRTALGALAVGSRVNLERAMVAGARLDGHIVQGHIDAALEVLSLSRAESGDTVLEMELPSEYAPLVAEKGSVAVDGVSLTVAALGEDRFSVCLIPETLKRTALSGKRSGSRVNIEFDIIGKYVRRQLECRAAAGESSPGLTMEKLSEAGFL